MTQILVFGTGGIGAVYVYMLQTAGAGVWATCRSNYDAVKSNGFSMESQRFGDIQFRPNHVVRSPEEAMSSKPSPTFDYVAVCSKYFPSTPGVPSTEDLIRPAVGQSTAIVLIQNGIGTEKDISAAFPNNPLITGVVYLPVTQTSAGVIRNPENLNRLEMGNFPKDAPKPHNDATSRFAEIVKRGGGGAEVFDDVQPRRWSKLLINAAWNPICALTMCTDGEFINSSPAAINLAWGVMLEVVAICKSLGIDEINEKEAKWQISRAKGRAKQHKGVEPSMLTDIKFNRPFEVEAIVGNAVRIARDQGVKTPLLDTIYSLAKARYEAVVKSSAR